MTYSYFQLFIMWLVGYKPNTFQTRLINHGGVTFMSALVQHIWSSPQRWFVVTMLVAFAAGVNLFMIPVALTISAVTGLANQKVYAAQWTNLALRERNDKVGRQTPHPVTEKVTETDTNIVAKCPIEKVVVDIELVKQENERLAIEIEATRLKLKSDTEAYEQKCRESLHELHLTNAAKEKELTERLMLEFAPKPSRKPITPRSEIVLTGRWAAMKSESDSIKKRAGDRRRGVSRGKDGICSLPDQLGSDSTNWRSHYKSLSPKRTTIDDDSEQSSQKDLSWSKLDVKGKSTASVAKATTKGFEHKSVLSGPKVFKKLRRPSGKDLPEAIVCGITPPVKSDGKLPPPLYSGIAPPEIDDLVNLTSGRLPVDSLETIETESWDVFFKIPPRKTQCKENVDDFYRFVGCDKQTYSWLTKYYLTIGIQEFVTTEGKSCIPKFGEWNRFKKHDTDPTNVGLCARWNTSLMSANGTDNRAQVEELKNKFLGLNTFGRDDSSFDVT